MSPDDLAALARELSRLQAEQAVFLGLDAPELIAAAIQAILAGVGICYVVFTYAIMKQGRQNAKDTADALYLAQKQYLKSIAPVLQVCLFEGHDNALTVSVKNLKENCPALSLCAVAYIPGLGPFADLTRGAAGSDVFHLNLHACGKELAEKTAGDFHLAAYWQELVNEINAGASPHGVVLILYRNMDGDEYVTRFKAYEREGKPHYKMGTEQQEMLDERGAMDRLAPPRGTPDFSAP